MRLCSAGINYLLIGALPVLFTGCPRSDGFENHLDEAIELYEVRMALYAEMTGGESDRLFDLLMTTEKAVKPVARYIDWRATPFISDGIPIVVDDFVSMDSAGDVYDPIEPAGELSDELKEELRELMSSFHRLKKDDFQGIADASYNGLLTVHELETQYRVHLPMMRHVIESIGFGALHAIQYSAVSDGETIGVSRELVSTQILGLGELIIVLECMANKVHQKGVGVLINDLPNIPFVEEYEQGRR
jgi:hypothetical protein